MSVSRETLSEAAVTVSRETGCSHDHRPASPLARLILLPIRAYRRFVSPLIAPRCRFYPSCSSYAMEAIRELGAFRGTIVAAWRVLRCNPFNAGGLDPLSERRLFRTHHEHRGDER
jgi:putative membrane protein insertion efficiency factor